MLMKRRNNTLVPIEWDNENSQKNSKYKSAVILIRIKAVIFLVMYNVCNRDVVTSIFQTHVYSAAQEGDKEKGFIRGLPAEVDFCIHLSAVLKPANVIVFLIALI